MNTQFGKSFVILLVCSLLVACSLFTPLPLASASEHARLKPASNTTEFDHSHSIWQSVLDQHVYTTGARSSVDYKTLLKDSSDLDQYLDQIKSVSEQEFSEFSENQKIAFLVNAYNAFVIRLILDNYPVESIRDIGWIFSSVWTKKFFKLFGKRSSLATIEHDILHKDFNEARIHFALVCGAKSCPALSKEAYLAERLDQQFETAARVFLQEPSLNRFDAAQSKLYLSSIFKWFKQDFDKKYGSVKAYVASRISQDKSEQTLILKDNVSISYFDYDWSLNDL